METVKEVKQEEELGRKIWEAEVAMPGWVPGAHRRRQPDLFLVKMAATPFAFLLALARIFQSWVNINCE